MDINEKLKEIKIENFILIIYYILLTLYYYANTIEIAYLKYKNESDKEKYRTLLYIIFGSLFIISLYFTITGINNLKKNTNQKSYKLEKLSVLAGILALFATTIVLYIVYEDKDIELEVLP